MVVFNPTIFTTIVFLFLWTNWSIPIEYFQAIQSSSQGPLLKYGPYLTLCSYEIQRRKCFCPGVNKMNAFQDFADFLAAVLETVNTRKLLLLHAVRDE